MDPKILIALLLIVGLIAGAGFWIIDSQSLGVDDQINAAVAATLAAIPTSTIEPIPTALPSPTPMPLQGLFCEYGFCIGHPSEITFFDASILQNKTTPSTASYGILAGYNTNLFIQLIWTGSGTSFDPNLVMSYVIEESDTISGSQDIQLVRDLDVYIQPITSVTSPLLPYGVVAAWQCGGRDFAWKVYTPQDGMGVNLLNDALMRFRCE
jgi:hypothetical protein